MAEDFPDLQEQDPETPARDQLRVDVSGWEGPLDVLLSLARDQKVDLTHISILELADQYLAWITAARRFNLELAADYLVMASWLAYLKSRLLLPEEEKETDEPTGEELAEALAFQLRRLEAMRQAGEQLMARPLLGQERFARAARETASLVYKTVYDVTLYDLLKAYADHHRRQTAKIMHIAPTELYSMEAALDRLRAVLGNVPEWTTLAGFLPKETQKPLVKRSALAATFAATLELAREGQILIRQDGLFGNIFIKDSPRNGGNTP
ncbi:MAG: segregation and condensation protein A [Magnetospiraceae bacterium]